MFQWIGDKIGAWIEPHRQKIPSEAKPKSEG
jgi:hypothetical protein